MYRQNLFWLQIPRNICCRKLPFLDLSNMLIPRSSAQSSAQKCWVHGTISYPRIIHLCWYHCMVNVNTLGAKVEWRKKKNLNTGKIFVPTTSRKEISDAAGQLFYLLEVLEIWVGRTKWLLESHGPSKQGPYVEVRLHTAINRADFVSWCMLYTYEGNKMHSPGYEIGPINRSV